MNVVKTLFLSIVVIGAIATEEAANATLMNTPIHNYGLFVNTGTSIQPSPHILTQVTNTEVTHQNPAVPDSTTTPSSTITTPPKEVVPENPANADEVHLIVRLSKRRVYVYRGDVVINSYPVAIGKKGWETPRGEFKVFSMEIDPVFKSFKTGRMIQPGPENPLGPRWIGIWTDGKTQLGFHGTNQPELIGKAVSHGCIRMHNQDAIALYKQVKIGTVVKVKP